MKANLTLLDRARTFRKNLTPEEFLLWSHLKDRKVFPCIFRRQQVFTPYILDFYSKSARLVIELDGAQHADDESRIYDKERTEYLETCGLKVIRFWNHEVRNNLKQKLDYIFDLSEQRRIRFK